MIELFQIIHNVSIFFKINAFQINQKKSIQLIYAFYSI